MSARGTNQAERVDRDEAGRGNDQWIDINGHQPITPGGGEVSSRHEDPGERVNVPAGTTAEAVHHFRVVKFGDQFACCMGSERRHASANSTKSFDEDPAKAEHDHRSELAGAMYSDEHLSL